MTVFATFAIILVLLAIGYALNRFRVVPENASATLNLVVLNVCLPAAILLYAPRLQFERELIGLVAIPWIILLVSAALVFALGRVLGFDKPSTANLLLQIPLGNTSYIGYSLIPLLVGAGALRYAVVYDQLGSFLILTTWGLFVISVYGGGERLRLSTIIRRVLRFPPFIALVLAFGLAHLFGLSREIMLVAVYLTAMPPMVTSGALLALAGLAPELAAALIGYGSILAMITWPRGQACLSY